MVKKRMSRGVALLMGAFVMALLVGGCAHTPEKRIRENAEVFETFPPDVQEAVRAGQVEIGYTLEMVFLALGAPDRKVNRRTANEAREIWFYQGRFLSTDTIRVHDQFGQFRPVRPVLYLDRTTEHTYTRARLEFVEGKLVSIEQTER